MMDRYKKMKNIDFDIFLGHNHYEECTGGESQIDSIDFMCDLADIKDVTEEE